MAKVFISYRRDDSAGHAGRLFDRLRQYLPQDSIVMDVESIRPGDDFIQSVAEAAGSSDVVIVVIGKRWLTLADDGGGRRLDDPNDIVRLEIRTALEQKHVRVIPTLVDGAAMPNRSSLPRDIESFARLQAVELSASRFDHDVQRLIADFRNVSIESLTIAQRAATLGNENGAFSVNVSPKYYIYISDRKVDMLYAQIPEPAKRSLHGQLGIPYGRREGSERDSERYSRVRIVSTYIERTFDVGTVDNPRSYFYGIHEMRWGPYGHTGAWKPMGKLEAKIVYFGGSTELTHFGLGGGLHHVIGNEKGKSPIVFHSSTPHLVSVLADELDESNPTGTKWWKAHAVMVRSEHRTDDLDEVKSLIAVMNANSVRGPKQRLEFLAKTLLYRKILTPIGVENPDENIVLLGSPIYVALADG